jgi:hypothetical protein
MTKHPKALSSSIALTIAALAALSCGQVAGQSDNIWDNDNGTFNYDEAENWSVNAIPEALFEEVALIDNGDAVFLETSTRDPGGLNVDTGSLEVRSGGTLNVVAADTATGSITVGTAGVLTVRGGGTLSGLSLSANGSLVMGQTGAGTATVTVSGPANLNGTTLVVGPDVAFQADGIGFGASHVLRPEITDPTTHSALSTTGTASLGGLADPVFVGVTPSIGDSWDLVDAGTITGAFTPSAVPVGPGVALFFETAAGGTNGQVVQANVGNQLQLAVDAVTGTMSINNLSATSTEEIDSYLITSTKDVFDTNNWSSFQSEGQTGWEEANPASNHLSELNLSGSRVIDEQQSISLGNAYLPAAEFGVPPTALSFSYSLPSGVVREGSIELSGYTLVLRVDPTTGEAAIVNPSAFDVEIDGYLITSASNSLDPDGWTSIASGDPNWEEANPLSNHLSELNLTDSQTILQQETGPPIALGALYDFDAPNAAQDLTFTFSLAPTDPNNPATTFAGVVQYGPFGPALEAGDANQDLEFNFDDIFQVLARGKYETGQPATWGEGDWDGAPGGAPGNPPTGSGQFDFDDIFASLVTGNYETGPYAADGGSWAVPEPSSLALTLLGVGLFAFVLRH